MKTSIFILVFVGILFTTKSFSQQSFEVVVKGEGAPVLLFPGFGCTGQVWDETVTEISKSKKCYIFTFAGFGKVKAIEKPWFATIKNDLEDYISKNNLQKSTLLGHSIGGTLSLWLASSNPDWFDKIILVDALPASAALMIPNYDGTVIPYDNPQSKSMLTMNSADFEKSNNQSVGYMCNNKEKQKLIATMMNQSDRKTFVYGYIDMLNLDLRSELTKIKVPVTILAASFPNKDIVSKTYQAQYKNLPQVNVLYAENAAHFVMYDQPEWFINQLNTILK
ncbi:MAG: alpha/beta hydrolase [Flavobacterium micromati]|nr:alpha/beta hydrolase [Flavobacterium micromati]